VVTSHVPGGAVVRGQPAVRRGRGAGCLADLAPLEERLWLVIDDEALGLELLEVRRLPPH